MLVAPRAATAWASDHGHCPTIDVRVVAVADQGHPGCSIIQNHRMGNECGVVFMEHEKPDFSFSGELRLHVAAEFSRVFAARRSLRGEYFDLHYLTDRPDFAIAGKNARLGLIVAKKLARRAVLRNQLKRLAREAFRHARSSLPPYDLVLRLARPPLKQKQPLPDLPRLWRADIDRLLLRLCELSRKDGSRQ